MPGPRSPALCLAAAVASLTLAACGTAKPAGPGPRQVVAEWDRAVADRDVDRACSLLDREGQDMIRRELAGWIRGHYTGSSCAALIGFLHDAVMAPGQAAQLRNAKATVLSVTGNRARVHASGDFELSKSDGLWRISEIPLASSKGPVG